MTKNRINYCLVKTNDFNSEIHDLLDEESLNMNNIEHMDKIQYEIDKLIEKSEYIKVSEIFEDNKSMMESMIDEILSYDDKEREKYERNGDNVMVFRDKKNKYTIFFFIKRQDDKNKVMNDLCTMLNMETMPLYDNCAIIKTKQHCKIKEENGDIINKDEIKKLTKMLFYHWGTIIEVDGNIKEIQYFGDNVIYTIGNTFDHIAIEKELYDKILRIYKEKGDDKNKEYNKFASDLLQENIYGRVYIIMLSDNRNKFWDFNQSNIDEIISLKNEGIKEDKYNTKNFYSNEQGVFENI